MEIDARKQGGAALTASHSAILRVGWIRHVKQQRSQGRSRELAQSMVVTWQWQRTYRNTQIWMQAIAVGCTGCSGGAERMSAATAVVFNVNKSIVEREREQHLCVVFNVNQGKESSAAKPPSTTPTFHVPTTGCVGCTC